MLSDSISDRTIALLLLDVFIVSKPQISLVQLIWTNKANVPADLQSAGIKYKDFNPLTSYFYFRYEFLIKKIATCCFLTFQAVNSLDFLIIIRLMRHLYNRLEPTKLMCRLTWHSMCNWYESTRQMCRLICNLPELCIRILIRLLPIFD